MITLRTSAEHDRLVRIIREAGSPEGREGGYNIRLGLIADDEDVSELFEKGDWGQSGLPITLDATIGDYLPRRLYDAPVSLVAEVEGIPVAQLYGQKTGILPGEDAYTMVLFSSSAGSLAHGDDSIKLREFTNFNSERPEDAVWKAIAPLPYSKSQIEIEPVPNVRITYSGSGENPGFLPHEPRGEVLNRLASDETVGYRYRDTVYNGFRAWVPTPLGRGTDPGPERTYNPAQLPDWLINRPTPPLERYSDVRVYRNGADGKPLWEVIEPVPYPGNVRPPHAGRTKDIAFEDDSDGGPENGRLRARREALEIARMVSVGEMLLPAFDPLIEINDDFRVPENHRDKDGTWDLLWGMRVEAYRHVYGGETQEGSGILDTIVGYKATLLEEDRIKAPTLILPGRSRSPVAIPRAPYGVQADDLYFTDATPGVEAQGDDLIFNDNSPAFTEGDDIVVGD